MRAAVILAAVALTIAFGCGGDDRPSDADWAVTWERERATVPTVDELVDGGRPLCDELVGEYRELMPNLTPTPSAALDDAVEEWVDEAETLVFECPTDIAEIDARLTDLDVLATEIDAGLDADAG